MNLTYRYRLYPNKTQTAALDRALSIGWRVYNDVHHMRQRDYFDNGISWTWQGLGKFWRQERNKHELLQFIPASAMVELIRRHDKALKAFFARKNEGVGYPKECKRRDFRSVPYRYGEGVKWLPVRPSVARLRVLNVGDVRMRQHRPLPCGCEIKQVVISKTKRGHWYASFQVELPDIDVIAAGEAVGVDVGIAYLLALSDGKTLDNPRWYKEAQRKRRIIGRKLDRQRRANNPDNYNPDGTVKENAVIWRKSNRQRETERQLARLEEHIAEQRKYFWHKVTDELTRTYSVIALENLTLDFMIQNKRLSMSAHDAAFGMFWQFLTYKAKMRGVKLLYVPPQYTSQTCSACGHVDSDNRKTQANFTCVSCGHSENADVNAAKNILNLALQTSVQDVRGVTQPNGAYVPRDAQSVDGVASDDAA